MFFAPPARARKPKDKALVENAVKLSFIKDARSLFITGSAGTGKSYIASALGYQACQKGLRVLYWSTSKLMGNLKASKLKGTYINDVTPES